MKTVQIEVDDLVYEFYNKVARQAGVPVEEIMSSALFRMAGELAMRLGRGEMRWSPEEEK